MSLEVFTWIIKKELPGPIVENQTALIDALKQIDETTNEYIEARTVFYLKILFIRRWTRVTTNLPNDF
ncbi:CDP-glycerol glycerophosphotransferase family protein [Staphylococcus aureus]